MKVFVNENIMVYNITVHLFTLVQKKEKERKKNMISVVTYVFILTHKNKLSDLNFFLRIYVKFNLIFKSV